MKLTKDQNKLLEFLRAIDAVDEKKLDAVIGMMGGLSITKDRLDAFNYKTIPYKKAIELGRFYMTYDGYYDTSPDTPNFVKDYLSKRKLLRPSGKNPASYVQALTTHAFAKWLIKNKPEVAQDWGLL